MPEIPKRDEIYVGYLPVPPGQRGFLRWVVPVILWLMCGASFLWARSQNSPGAAVFDQGKPVTMHGTLVTKPYPMLFTLDTDKQGECILLVEPGKHGAAHHAAELDGKSVTVSGWPLVRDGRRILELEPIDTSLVVDAHTFRMDVPPPRSLGRVTLQGEIVDSKCFLGAMKPGEGKTHKECATLCIRGGIPPMFVTRDAAGLATYYLLRDPGGGPVDPAIFPLIADPVEVTGDLATWGGLNVFTITATNVRRL